MKAFLIFSISILFSLAVFAQDEVRTLKTAAAMRAESFTDGGLIKRQATIEQFIRSGTRESVMETVTLPIVFHVLYDSPSNQLSKEELEAQIEALNRDFSGEISQNEHNGGDSKIRFCLADLDGESNIVYQSTNRSDWSISNRIKKENFGGSDPVSPAEVINIWIGSLKDNMSGFAMMPGTNPELDGLVIDFDYFGVKPSSDSKYNEGKTLTHLMGNYLGLYPLWGPTKCQDDFVEDTPIHNSPNYGCDEKRHFSTCSPGTIEMIGNFMDNTYDECMDFFTAGQIQRMRKLFAKDGPREGLLDGLVECSTVEPDLKMEEPSALRFTLSPNPASKIVFIEIAVPSIEEKIGELNFYNENGELKKVISIEFISKEERISVPIDDLSSGIYLLEFVKNEERITTKFFVSNN